MQNSSAQKARQRRWEERQCSFKTRYRTKRKAILKISRTNESGLTSYECRVCGWWHVGHGYKKEQ